MVENEESHPHRRESIKSSVHNTPVQQRRRHAISVGKERREVLMRTKRMRRNEVSDNVISAEGDMIIDEEREALGVQTSETFEDLKSVLLHQGKGTTQKKLEILRTLRHLLSRCEIPPIEAALKAGAVPVLVQCLSFGSPDEQLLEAAWCLTNIAAGEPEETNALLPALPLLIAHLGENSSVPVAEQCAWALGNVAGEGVDLRNVLLAQGALLPLARLMLSNKGSTTRTAAWALSNLIKGPDPKAATELVRIDRVLDAIIQHLKMAGDELATEVAWLVVYLSALSETAVCLLVNTNIAQLLVGRLEASENLQLLIPVLRSLGNIVAAGGSYLTVRNSITVHVISAVAKCLNSNHRVLNKEAAWLLSNLAAGSFEQKELIFLSEATHILIDLLSTAPFDIRKEVAYALGNLCVLPADCASQPTIIRDHLVALVNYGCLAGFINLVKSADIEGAKVGLQFLGIVMRGLPNGIGPKLVEKENGIEAMERFQFHENEDMRSMANGLVDKYFGEDYGLDE